MHEAFEGGRFEYYRSAQFEVPKSHCGEVAEPHCCRGPGELGKGNIVDSDQYQAIRPPAVARDAPRISYSSTEARFNRLEDARRFVEDLIPARVHEKWKMISGN